MPNGYGQYRTAEDNLTAHRLLWELLIDEVPEGHHLHHRCKNRLCVNPYHLEVLNAAAHIRHHRKVDACPRCGSSRWIQRYYRGKPNGHRCADCHARQERERQQALVTASEERSL